MDWNYLLALLAFAFGALSAYQAIHQRYSNDSVTAAFSTLLGWSYIFLRASLPAALFVLAYYNRWIDSYPAAWAAGIGTGWELALRCKFYIREKGSTKGTKPEELLRGPADAVRWLEAHILEGIAQSLAGKRKRFVQRHSPQGITFPELCEVLRNNLPAWPDEKLRERLEDETKRVEAEFQEKLAGGASGGNQLDEKYRLILAYKVLDAVGKGGFKTLLSRAS